MSDWIQHVKKYAKDKGVTYKEAMTKAKATYKPKSKSKKMKDEKMKK